MPGTILYCTRFNEIAVPHTPVKGGLRLMLWAGDGIHDGITDAERLPNYDVYLCGGYGENNVNQNMFAMKDEQTLCLLDIYNQDHLELFHRIYDGRFSLIDSDYIGNTPKLPLEDYSRLLSGGGIARNIEGISGLNIPYHSFHAMLEFFAPVLPKELLAHRRWSIGIMELSKRDDLPPEMVWTSSDLQHPYYKNTVEAQTWFETSQKKKNPLWPYHSETLEAHWSNLTLDALVIPVSDFHAVRDLTNPIEIVMPHMKAFGDFLTVKINTFLALNHERFNMNQDHYQEHLTSLEPDILSIVRYKQTILKMFQHDLPPGMTGLIGFYEDDRYPQKPRRFGFTLQKEQEASGLVSTAHQ